MSRDDGERGAAASEELGGRAGRHRGRRKEGGGCRASGDDELVLIDC